MSSCCGNAHRPARFVTVKCPKCGGHKVYEQGGSMSLVWYACALCGHLWQSGW